MAGQEWKCVAKSHGYTAEEAKENDYECPRDGSKIVKDGGLSKAAAAQGPPRAAAAVTSVKFVGATLAQGSVEFRCVVTVGSPLSEAQAADVAQAFFDLQPADYFFHKETGRLMCRCWNKRLFDHFVSEGWDKSKLPPP